MCKLSGKSTPNHSLTPLHHPAFTGYAAQKGISMSSRALTCEIDQSSRPKHTHPDNELCGKRVALTHTHTHSCKIDSLTHTHTHTLQLSLSTHLKWHLKWNCWKIKNRSRHFVFHATRRLIIKTDFYMQRQCQRKCMLQAHVHRYICVCVCVWVSSIQSSWVRFVSVWLGT